MTISKQRVERGAGRRGGTAPPPREDYVLAAKLART